MKVVDFAALLVRRTQRGVKQLVRRLPLPGLRKFVEICNRLAEVERVVADFRKSFQIKMRLQEDRLAKKLAELQRSVEQGELPRLADSTLHETPAGSFPNCEQIVFLFAHARLPAPSAAVVDRAKVLGVGGIDFRSLGYEIYDGNAPADTVVDLAIERLDDEALSAGTSVRARQTAKRTIFCNVLKSPTSEELSQKVARIRSFLADFRINELVVARREASTWAFVTCLHQAEVCFENHRDDAVILVAAE